MWSETFVLPSADRRLCSALLFLQGNYSDLLVALSNVYAELRGTAGQGVVSQSSHEESITTKYWIRMSDISSIKHHILQHLPVYQFNEVNGNPVELLPQ